VAEVTFHGESVTLLGSPPVVGENAPYFSLLGGRAVDPRCLDTAWMLERGMPTLLSVVTSVDTPIGSLQTKVFEKRLSDAALGDQVTGLLVSTDLPFTLTRFCRAEDIDHLAAGSDYRERRFGRDWGILIEEHELLTRAVFVIDRDGVLRYSEIVPEITSEPDYASALNVLFDLV
jgi:thioredoxin-dependent peroxiredoxin